MSKDNPASIGRPLHPAWRVIDSTPVLSAPPWLRVYRERVELPDGSVIEEFHRFRMQDGVILVAITPLGEVLTVRGYRHGAGRVVLGLPAGGLEPGESVLEAAARELLEETGYAVGESECLGSFLVEPGRQNAVAHVVVTRNVRRVAAPRVDASEAFEIELVPIGRILEVLRQAEAVSLSMVAAISLALLSGEADGTCRGDA